MPSPTLYLAGSLCPRALAHHMATAGTEDAVFEFDTLLDRSCHPQVGAWFATRDFLAEGMISTLRRLTEEQLFVYVRSDAGLGDLPGDEELRRAAISAGLFDSVFTHLLNTHFFQGVMARFKPGRIIAMAGCGINFAFWREMAERHGMEITLIPPEPRRRSLARWWEKKRYKRLARIRQKAVLAAGLSSPEEVPAPGSDLPLVFCSTRRVQRLLQQDGGSRNFRLRQVDIAELGAADAMLHGAEAARHLQRHQAWMQQGASPDIIWGGGAEALRDFKQRLGPVLESLAQNVLSRWSALRAKAVQRLEQEKPRLLLADTQIAEEDGVWVLAARQLGIPVVSYSYDYIVNMRTSVIPDWVLADGMRTIPRALAGGYPRERMIDVRAHRRPVRPERNPQEAAAAYGARCPLILMADPPSISADPQLSMFCSRVVVEAARRMPHLRFVIKFHPLRAGKTEERSFVGMDESEVNVKKRFIQSLRPPGNVSCLAPEASMEDCLGEAAVLLSTNSMSGHEAFHIGVPVIFMCQHERESITVTFPEIDERMSPLYAEDAETLVAQLRQLTESTSFREAQIAAQRRYLNHFYWSSELTLTAAISRLLSPDFPVPPPIPS